MNVITQSKLISSGIDPLRARRIVNVFKVYCHDDTAILCRILELAGFGIVTPGEQRSFEGKVYWLVEGTSVRTAELGELDSMTDICVQLVHELNAEYDGWYTEVD